MVKEDKHPEDEKLNDNGKEENIDEPTDESAVLKEEVQKLKDTLLRKAAETENLRKRLEKEKEDAVKYSNVKFASDLLGVIDNFERINENSEKIKAQTQSDESLKAFLDGISLCGKELLSVFKKHGILKIEVSKGDAFDHRYHQAMCELEDCSHEKGAVIEVFQSGYTYHDRLLRPAMVSVSKKA